MVFGCWQINFWDWTDPCNGKNGTRYKVQGTRYWATSLTNLTGMLSGPVGQSDLKLFMTLVFRYMTISEN